MKIFLVYALIDPTNGEMRYVGKSSSGMKRPRSYFRESQLKIEGSGRKKNWLSKLLRQGLVPEIEVLETVACHDDLVESEIFWISYYRFVGANLTNLTAGGEGAPGIRQSASTIEKRIAPLRGRKASEETRLRMSAAQKGRKVSREQRAKISASLTGRHASFETKEKMRLKHLGKMHSEESLKKMRKPPDDQPRDPRGGHRPNTPLARPVADDLGNVFSSVGEAARELGVDRALIRRIVQGKQSTARGRKFEWA